MAEETTPPPASSSGAIQTDPAVLSGKPFIAGTRLSVEFLQGLSAIGWTAERILGVYTYITPEELAQAMSHKVSA